MTTTSAWDNIPETRQSKVPLIAICIPYNNMEPEFIERVFTRLRYAPVDFANKAFFLSKAPSLPVARNALVQQALKANADYLFFMDSDHSFEDPTNPNGFTDPNAALKVLYQLINKDQNSKRSLL